ncbi:MAG: VOC family protein [Armatimonadetes bacterium]|nr:VOC family protein [Armatimonadota bacterium]
MHTFVHVEIPTGDLRRAKAFYGKIFGWTFQDYGKEYALIQAPGSGFIGGLQKVKKVPTRPAVQVYIDVEDIDAKLKAIRKARGKVVRPKGEVPNMGWYAAFADNQGAVLFLWQAIRKPQQTGLPM